MFNTKNLIMVLIGAIFLSVSGQAYAYLDPGTGSMLLQLLIGGVVAAFLPLKFIGTDLKHLYLVSLAKLILAKG